MDGLGASLTPTPFMDPGRNTTGPPTDHTRKGTNIMNNLNPSQNGSEVNGPHMDPSWASAATELPPPPGYEAYPYAPPQFQQQAHPQQPTPHPPTGVVPNRKGLALWALMAPPIGLFALYLVSQVTVKQSLGDTSGAIETAHKARIVSLVGIVVGGVFWSMYLMAACAAAAATPTY